MFVAGSIPLGITNATYQHIPFEPHRIQLPMIRMDGDFEVGNAP
jgi:hypothetical protein